MSTVTTSRAGPAAGPLARLTQAARPARRGLAAAVLLGAVALAAGIGLTVTAAWLIARASQMPPVLSLTVAVVGVRFFGITRPVLRYLERLVSHDAAFRVLADLRARIYDRLVPLAPGRLGGRRRGELLAGIVSDVDAVEDLHLRVIEPSAVAVLVSALAVGVAGWLLPSAGVILAVAMGLAGVAAPLTAAAAGRRAEAALAPARAQLADEVVDLLRGAPDLIATGAAAARLARVDAADATLTGLARRTAWAVGLGSGLAVLASGGAVWASAVAGVTATGAGRLSGVTLAVIVMLPLAAFEALAPLPTAATLLARVRTSAERLFGLVDTPPAVTDPAEPDQLPPPPAAGRHIRLQDVAARWTPDGPLVLDGVALDLPAGHHVAITGPSGSGKSTLAAVLLRFLDPVRGRISLDGLDVRRFAADDLRTVIGLVGDDDHVFASTLRENLRLARPGAGDGELVAALRAVHLGEWYDTLPAGLDTWLGEGGSLVSGGERRRLGLARAVLADWPVLVLDEPTEGLDPPTAQALMDDLSELTRGRTVVLFTHRPEGLDLVDRVLTVSDGRLVPVRPRPPGTVPHAVGRAPAR
jgi:thiol reductant ABC exporter CydC subunit